MSVSNNKSSKSPSLRRIQADIRELSFDPSPRYHAAPLEADMFEWYDKTHCRRFPVWSYFTHHFLADCFLSC
jgi:hypothetical protein